MPESLFRQIFIILYTAKNPQETCGENLKFKIIAGNPEKVEECLKKMQQKFMTSGLQQAAITWVRSGNEFACDMAYLLQNRFYDRVVRSEVTKKIKEFDPGCEIKKL